MLVHMFGSGSIESVLETVRRLAALDPAVAAERDVVDAMTAAAGVAAWAESVGLAAVGELTARRRQEHLHPDPGSRTARGLGARNTDEVDAFIGSEVAAALRLSRDAARDRMALAEDLRTRLPGTAAALRAASLSVQHARRISDSTTGLTAAAAGRVEQRVLARTAALDATQTPAQTAAACRRAALAVDPDHAQVRCEAARRRRRAWVRPLPDGMASIEVTGRAELVDAAWLRIDALAQRQLPGGDTDGARPTLDQARADTVLQLLLGTSERLADAPGVSVQLDVVVPIGTVLGVSDEPGQLPGHGPLPAAVVRELAGDATWRRFLCDDDGVVTGVGRRRYRPPAALADAVRARDLTCRFPGCRRRAVACDLDHTRAFPAGPTDAANLGAYCRHHHRVKHRAGWSVVQGDAGRMAWTSPSGAEYTTYPPSWGAGPPGGEDDQPDDADRPDCTKQPDEPEASERRSDPDCADEPDGSDHPDSAPTSEDEDSGVPWDIGVR